MNECELFSICLEALILKIFEGFVNSQSYISKAIITVELF